MKLLQTYSDDMLNGTGLREVLFFSSCDFSCPGCFNSEAQDPNCDSYPGSHEWTDKDYDALVERLRRPHISGVTISGGDGFSKWNKKEVLELCKKLKTDVPEKTIWIYTGYTFEAIKEIGDEKWECLKYIDVLVDGQFVEKLRSPHLPWVGSSNQRVIDVKETLKNGKICVI